ncbi:MAG TPA: DoxX family protein [Lacibacter sp.]|nr:DoxX family protein [Lacibacter sp.]
MNKFLSAKPLWPQTGLAIVRIITGLFLIYHGWELFSAAKMYEYLQWDQFKNDFGKVMTYAGKAAELIAGILFVLGLFTRIACILTAGVMLFITFKLGNGIVWYNDQHPFLFVLIALVFFCTGPGNWSLDAKLFDKK